MIFGIRALTSSLPAGIHQGLGSDDNGFFVGERGLGAYRWMQGGAGAAAVAAKSSLELRRVVWQQAWRNMSEQGTDSLKAHRRNGGKGALDIQSSLLGMLYCIG